MTSHTTSADVIVVGAGVAGMSAALALADRRVHLVCKGAFGATGASPLAQGGMAVALGGDDDPRLHAADTLAVSGGTADASAVTLLTGEAPNVVRHLVELGAAFDRNEGGQFALGREAGHTRSRILHARDATGAEIVRAMSEAVRRAAHVSILEGRRVVSLAQARGRVVGVWTTDGSGSLVLHVAPAVVLATGGVGQLYARTTNPVEATGDGLALALRVGARLADVEFVQFHPTALDVGADPMPLVTEALRGAGAEIVDADGRRFLLDHDARGELAPRDVVSLALYRHLARGGRAFLDARRAVGEAFPVRFPTVFDACVKHGIDPRVSVVPVAPAAHYHMGGVATDSHGRTSVDGLWACGEVACTGVHGANRLASNSLLEGLVFGGRVAADIIGAGLTAVAAPVVAPVARPSRAADAAIVRRVRRLMWERVGLERNGDGLADTLERLDRIVTALGAGGSAARDAALVARAIASAAFERCESRGAHFRTDFPRADTSWARRHYAREDAPLRAVRVTGVRR